MSAPQLAERYERLPLTAIAPSLTNPRQHFDTQALAELAASIREKGVMTPILVRPVNGSGSYEIVAGERRHRASVIAEQADIPAVIREYSDEQVLELQLIENVQRHDLHPLEEADGYARLMKIDAAYTAKAIAARIGKSERYVQQRLQLARLAPVVKEAFLENHITAGHADLLSRLSAEDQARGLKACFENLYGEDKERGSISVRALNQWIDEHIRLPLRHDDPQTQLFPDVAKAIAKDSSAILQVSSVYGKTPDDVLSHDAYREIHGKKDRCKFARRAVVVLGRDRGHLIDICTADAECKTHWKWKIDEAAWRQKTAAKSGAAAPSASDRAAAKRAHERQQKEEAQRKVWSAALKQATAALKKKPIKPDQAVLAVLAWRNARLKTWTDVVVDELDRLYVGGAPSWKTAVRLFKPFGVDLVAIEKRLVAETKKPAPASAAKKAKKKS